MTKKELRQVDESGRSMTEMLGTLAIMGVLAIGGIAGYRFAMDKYKANDILNEVRKRAVVASQQRVTGREAISFDEYGNSLLGYTTTPSSNYDGDSEFFTISVAGIEKEICDNVIAQKMPLSVGMKAGAAGSESDVELGDECVDGENTVIFAFANTLDPNATPNTGGNGGGNGDEGQTPSDDTPSCENGTWTDGTCLCDSGYVGTDCSIPTANACSGNGYLVSDLCDCTGTYHGEDCTEPVGEVCTKNEDCKTEDGEVDTNKYCNITKYSYSNNSYEPISGTCQSKGRLKSTGKIEALGKTLYYAGEAISWDAAKNWCQAHGKSMFNPSGNVLGCSNANLGSDRSTEMGYCCAKGTSCGSDITQQSAVMQALRKALRNGNFWTSNEFWGTGAYTNYGIKGFYIGAGTGYIGVANQSNDIRTLCE